MKSQYINIIEMQRHLKRYKDYVCPQHDGVPLTDKYGFYPKYIYQLNSHFSWNGFNDATALFCEDGLLVKLINPFWFSPERGPKKTFRFVKNLLRKHAYSSVELHILFLILKSQEHLVSPSLNPNREFIFKLNRDFVSGDSKNCLFIKEPNPFWTGSVVIIDV